MSICTEFSLIYKQDIGLFKHRQIADIGKIESWILSLQRGISDHEKFEQILKANLGKPRITGSPLPYCGSLMAQEPEIFHCIRQIFQSNNNI